MSELLIVNTGGTFNKRYREIEGDLAVPADELALEGMLVHFRGNVDYRLIGLIHKDSLEMNEADRALLARRINEEAHARILVVHGTDTLHQSAAFLEAQCPGRRIVLTGAMRPAAFADSDAMMNFAMSYGFLMADRAPGVFIGLHGLVRPHGQISKDRMAGVFRAC